MARGEVKEAVGQGSSPMREALCLRLKDGAVWEVVLAARCLEWRARASLDSPTFEEHVVRAGLKSLSAPTRQAAPATRKRH